MEEPASWDIVFFRLQAVYAFDCQALVSVALGLRVCGAPSAGLTEQLPSLGIQIRLDFDSTSG